MEDAEPGRDEFEIDLARRAMAADLPLLAICRAHRCSTSPAAARSCRTSLRGRVRSAPRDLDAPDAVAHEVDALRTGSRLHDALGSAVAAAANLPRQQPSSSVRRTDLATGLVATATASDGVVEAIEQPDARFCLGIQWHPENFWRTGEFKPLFESFVAAARERMTESEF